jgi:LPS-assembly protein
MRGKKRIGAVGALVASLLVPFSVAIAQKGQLTDKPVLMTADEMQYDQDLGLIVAKGHVELSQQDQVLLADTVTYNQRTDTVTASGNVSMMQPTGDVAFANYMELRDNFRDGFIKDARLLLSDRSRMAGNTARRVGGTRTEVRRAVYSPCELCAADPTHAPTWQIKAEQAVNDKELQIVEYRDAIMEIDGFPVLYLPYFSHPDPSVKRASGFLPPIIGSDSSNGFRVGIPYYLVLGPDKDAIFRPIFTTEGGTVLDGQYRQRFGNGILRTDTSVTIGSQAANTTLPNVRASNGDFRGHVFADGVWDLTPSWRAGLNATATTDQTYLQRYHFPYSTNFLTDHAYIENFGRASYGTIGAYAFQNLNPNFGIADEPIVLPTATYTLTTPPDVLGGRWQVNGNVLNLTSRTGIDERRLSLGTSWRLPFAGPIGDRYQLSASLRGDGYHSRFGPNFGSFTDNTTTPPTIITGPYSQTSTQIEGRAFPQLALNWRYPWIRPGDSITTVIEPIAAVFAAPTGGNPLGIPNEDSQSFEFDETDLFEANRFAGYDRVDGGQRVDYGLHAGIYNPIAGSTQILVGESYRLQRNTQFPVGTGLDHRRSDVVGRVMVSPGRYFDVFYRARLDSQDLAMRRQEVGMSAGPSNFTTGISYISTSRIPGLPSVLPAKQISGVISMGLTDNWSAQISHTQNLNNGSTSLHSGLQITYRDDCLAVVGALQRSGIAFGDLHSGTSFVLTFVFRNLGDVSVQPFGS